MMVVSAEVYEQLMHPERKPKRKPKPEDLVARDSFTGEKMTIVSAEEFFKVNSAKKPKPGKRAVRKKSVTKVRKAWFILKSGTVPLRGAAPTSGAISLGRGPLDPKHPPVREWWWPGELPETLFRVPRLDARMELTVMIEGLDNGKWGCPPEEGGPRALDIRPDAPESSGVTFRDDGALFRKKRKTQIWAENEECMVVWSTKGAFSLSGEFDPAKVVLPFASYRTASGETRRVLLVDRAEYDGKPMKLDYREWQSMPGMTNHDVPSFWTEGPDGLKPYDGPWGED